jgi:hypothetical protein
MPKTAEHSWDQDHRIEWNKAKTLHTEENRYIKKLNETVFIKTEEQVISQPRGDVSTIWHTMLLRQEVGMWLQIVYTLILHRYSIPIYISVVMIPTHISNSQIWHLTVAEYTGYTKTIAGTSGTCSLEIKTDKKGQFAVFYSSTETVFLHSSGRC